MSSSLNANHIEGRAINSATKSTCTYFVELLLRRIRLLLLICLSHQLGLPEWLRVRLFHVVLSIRPPSLTPHFPRLFTRVFPHTFHRAKCRFENTSYDIYMNDPALLSRTIMTPLPSRILQCKTTGRCSRNGRTGARATRVTRKARGDDMVSRSNDCISG